MSANIRNILLLTVVWLAIVIVVNPYGEFPYSDDFAYAGPVKKMLETGQLRITDWTSMTLIGHLSIGYLASLIFGFSFLTLRMTVLVFALASAVGSYLLGKHLLGSETRALIVSLIFMLTPQFVLNSFSFMTDITFICFAIWASYYFVRFYDEEKYLFLASALALNIYAYLIRDIGIIIPIAFSIAYIISKGFKLRNLVISAIPIILILIVFLGYRYWFENFHGLTKSIDFSRNRFMMVINEPMIFIKGVVRNYLLSMLYLGFYLLPLLIPEAVRLFKNIKNKKYYIITAVLIFTASLVTFFIIGNIPHLAEFMLGDHLRINSLLVPDVHNPSDMFTNILPSWIVMPAYILGIFGAVILLTVLYDRVIKLISDFGNRNSTTTGMNFIFLFIVFYHLLLLTQIPFNRYYILMFLLLGLLISINIPEFHQNGRITRYATIVVFAIIGLSSIAAAHNMMQYNRARWQAADYLIEDLNVPAEKIDGGFEFNAYYFYNYDYKKDKTKNWWFVQDDEYVISWGAMQSHATIREIKYFRFYPPDFSGRVYIGKRK